MGCVGWLATVGSAVIAWLLWRSHVHRSGLDRRLGALELEVGELRSRLTRGSEVASGPTETMATAALESVGARERAAEPARAATEVALSASQSVEGLEPEDPDRRRVSLPPAESTFEVPAAEVPAAPSEQAPEIPPPASRPPEPPESTPLTPARPTIDWEQWIGVRGAAVLGGIVLALAGIYFVRYSIEAGWVPPMVRITLALLAGVAAILAGEALRKRDYAFSANGLAGAGVVMLYAAIWAGRNLYALFGSGLAFALMALVTVAGGVLSWRYRSQVIALLGLVGGFATPLLISADSDRPIGLFGYLLLLNVGVALLARRTGWSLLGAVALGGTVLYQALWIFGRMDSERTWLGLLILGAFVAFYAVVGWLQRRSVDPDEPAPAGRLRGPLELLQHVGAVLTPFGFALYFAAQSELGEHLWPIALLLVLLNLAAAFVSRVHGLPFVAPAASAGSLGIVFVWSLRASLDARMIWEVVAVLIGLAVLHHLSLEARRWFRPASWSESLAAAVAAGGALFWLLVVWVALGERPSAFWIAFGAAGIAALLLLRQSQVTGRLVQEITAAAGLGLHLVAAILVTLSAEPTGPRFSVVLLLALAIGAAFQAWVLWRRKTTATRESGGPTRGREVSAAVAAALPLLGLLGWASATDLATATRELVPFHAGSLVLALLLVLSATRARSGLGYGMTMALLALVQLAWTGDALTESPLPALGLQLLSVVIFSFWPLAARLATAGTRRAAALAGPVWFVSLYGLYSASFGREVIGLLPIGLGVLSLLAGYGRVRLDARQQDGVDTRDDDAGEALLQEAPAQQRRRSTLAWYGGVTLGFVALAIPLQLDKEWITVAWALQALAVTVLWKRVDHPGLKVFGLALQLAVAIRLIANPELFDYHATGSEPFGLPVLNWLLYAYLVPVAALVLSARILEPLEVLRLRASERSLYRLFRGKPAIAALYGLLAVAVFFVWINLTIFDAFAPGSPLAISFDRQPTRDLVLSLSWALFALGLLMLGVSRKSAALRWISLAFFLLTIGKVFLYDLGELTDLYRVASLVGLAFSLIVVSLLYQRFVFGRDRGTGSD